MPTIVAMDKSLPDSAKILLAIVSSLMGKYGFCWATNASLAKMTGKTTRQVQRNLELLKKKNEIIVEIESNFDRKIWTPSTWVYREKYIKAYGEGIVNCGSRDEFNQRIYGYDMNVVGGTTSTSSYNTMINIQRHKEESAPPPPSKIQKQKAQEERPPDKPNDPNTIYLKPMLTTGHVPSPGRPEMVTETKEFLSRPLECGTKRYVIADKDKEWFYGFSPKVLEVAATRIHLRSKKGDKISKYTVMLFAECAKVRGEY